MKIFISYSHRDGIEFARVVKNACNNLKYDVFMDEEIKIAEKWNIVIRNEIKSSNAVIVILTEMALKSDEIKKEVNEAQILGIKIVPCFDKKILHNNIPYNLRSIQGIEFNTASELNSEFYKKIQILDSNKIREILNDGETFHNKGLYEKAMDCYNLVLQIDPDNFSAWFSKGNSSIKVGKYREAIDCYNVALQIDPTDVITLKNKGYAYKRLGNNEEAKRSYDKAKDFESKKQYKINIFKKFKKL